MLCFTTSPRALRPLRRDEWECSRKPTMRSITIACIAFAVLLATDVAFACPMCKVAAESDDRLPRAFMLSILFMLAMPFTLAAVFGTAFYRLSKKMPPMPQLPEQQQNDE